MSTELVHVSESHLECSPLPFHTWSLTRTYHNDIVRVTLLGLNENILRDPLLDNLRLLKVDLNLLPALETLLQSLAVRLVNQPSRHVLVKVDLTQRTRRGLGTDVGVDNDSRSTALGSRLHTARKTATSWAAEALCQNNLALDIDAIVVIGRATVLTLRAQDELGDDTFLGRRGRVGQAVDVLFLAVDLEGDALNLAEPGGEVLLPGLGTGRVADVRPDVVDRGGVPG